MVSGLVTSPFDQDKISSGEASFIRMDWRSVTRMVVWFFVFFLSRFPCCFSSRLFFYLHVQAQRAKLIHQKVERSRQVRRLNWLAPQNALIGCRSSGHVV